MLVKGPAILCGISSATFQKGVWSRKRYSKSIKLKYYEFFSNSTNNTTYLHRYDRYERQEAHILKFNSLPPHAQLVCQVNLFQLPYEDGCSHELLCTKCATWLCIILFQILFIHISAASYCEYKMLSNIVNNTYLESCDSAYYGNVKVVHLPAFWAAHLSVMLEWYLETPILGWAEFLQKPILNSKPQKSALWTRKLSPDHIYLNQVDISTVFLR